MAEPRGTAGSVRGIPAELATEMLVQLVTKLHEQGGKTITRQQVVQRLENDWPKLPGRQRDGVLLALERMPGLRKLGAGTYLLPEDPELWAENRLWKFPTALLNLSDARELYAILLEDAVTGQLVSPNLWRYARRLGRALAGVLPATELFPDGPELSAEKEAEGEPE